MTRYLEDLVRQAQERQAERAVDPERIRAALPARAARRARRRTGLLVAAAVAVVAAVTVPIVVLRPGEARLTPPAGPPPATEPAATPSAAQARAEIAPLPLRYRPTWLPPGVRERSRMAGFDSPSVGVSRMWTTSPANGAAEMKGPRLELDPRPAQGADDPPANDGKRVDIGGKTGYYHAVDSKAYLEWRVDADTVLSISQHDLDLSEQEMLKVARSVRADPRVMRVPLRFGWLPDGMVPGSVEFVGDSPSSWHARVGVEQPAGVETAPPSREEKREEKTESTPWLSVAVGTITVAPGGGETMIVGGRPARIVGGSADVTYLVLDKGLVLTVSGSGLERDDLVAIAERVEVDPAPDLSWLGSR